MPIIQSMMIEVMATELIGKSWIFTGANIHTLWERVLGILGVALMQ